MHWLVSVQGMQPTDRTAVHGDVVISRHGHQLITPADGRLGAANLAQLFVPLILLRGGYEKGKINLHYSRTFFLTKSQLFGLERAVHQIKYVL